jgi:hypothetical protein
MRRDERENGAARVPPMITAFALASHGDKVVVGTPVVCAHTQLLTHAWSAPALRLASPSSGLEARESGGNL